jgi:hypothetical protein
VFECGWTSEGSEGGSTYTPFLSIHPRNPDEAGNQASISSCAKSDGRYCRGGTPWPPRLTSNSTIGAATECRPYNNARFNYKAARNALGVAPASLRNAVVKWLWLENPERRAISEIGNSVSSSIFFALSIRRSAM